MAHDATVRVDKLLEEIDVFVVDLADIVLSEDVVHESKFFAFLWSVIYSTAQPKIQVPFLFYLKGLILALIARLSFLLYLALGQHCLLTAIKGV